MKVRELINILRPLRGLGHDFVSVFREALHGPGLSIRPQPWVVCRKCGYGVTNLQSAVRASGDSLFFRNRVGGRVRIVRAVVPSCAEQQVWAVHNS